MGDPRIASGRDKVWKASVIRSEIRSRAELNCALHLFLHPSYQRDTAHRPIGTGRLRARRRFGYWGEQIRHLRAQSGHHFGAAPAELEPVVVPSLARGVRIGLAQAQATTQNAEAESRRRQALNDLAATTEEKRVYPANALAARAGYSPAVMTLCVGNACSPANEIGPLR